MRKALLVFGAVFLAGLIFTAVAVAADANSLVVDDNGNVGIRTTTPLDSLHVNGQIRSNANMIMGTPSSVPDDIWGGPYLTNQTGFIGSMGGYALDMVWNGYRRIPDDKYNVRGINGSDTVNAISLDDIGIRFKTKDGMSNGDDQPPTRMIINRNGNVGNRFDKRDGSVACQRADQIEFKRSYEFDLQCAKRYLGGALPDKPDRLYRSYGKLCLGYCMEWLPKKS